MKHGLRLLAAAVAVPLVVAGFAVVHGFDSETGLVADPDVMGEVDEVPAPAPAPEPAAPEPAAAPETVTPPPAPEPAPSYTPPAPPSTVVAPTQTPARRAPVAVNAPELREIAPPPPPPAPAAAPPQALEVPAPGVAPSVTTPPEYVEVPRPSPSTKRAPQVPAIDDAG